ncbi:hypothetical protein ACFCX0_13020 [Streptomyces sp. NPDC056352]
MRSRLVRAGFGPLQSGLWVAQAGSMSPPGRGVGARGPSQGLPE